MIKRELIEWLDGNIINLHGAILPAYKGAFTYNWGIYNHEQEWGATAHFVNERFDEGDIIQIQRFTIDPEQISVSELERKTQEAAYTLSLELVEKIANGIELSRIPQTSEGKYYSRKDFEDLKRISVQDGVDQINRKIHACWCPPYEGAYVVIGGQKYSIINSEIMETLANG